MGRGGQILLAAVFLTRLPLARWLPPRVLPLGRAAWAFPLVGAAIGAVAGLPLLIGGPPLLGAVLSLALSVLLTGALHEDGLADLADAAGGRDRDTRLAIMRDSRIGSYGVMALVLTSLARVAALGVLGPFHLMAAAAGGRAAAVLAMAALPPARSDGLAHAAGAPGWRNVLAASGIALPVLWLAGPGWPGAMLAGLAALALVIRQARIWLGGHSGDVLGAASVAVETAMLVGFALTAAAP
ncbi:adenosylcobinamide-GDP ribazoletransferase [Paracoccus spongiarum]|uniref:Adenosylcobinamide-GDP ribazoletransferase n=1 Tax=Paracoccus spongiarum TaxID=3064387 RepID=A0ABT9JIT4_9RHOB|nr:adenosylcobinamide-GDP ribazoletransferase [Paracoccus sp. 2205BS29-5]MDP5308956.1 adenosylcobinamide-GDP ribazoletransferase [Paracoccus sp. 2205BS29-5]